MSPPDDSSFRILDWVIGAFMSLLGLVWKLQSDKVKDLKEEIADHRNEHRQDVSTLYSKIDEMSRTSTNRHFELLQAIHTGLSGKQDK